MASRTPGKTAPAPSAGSARSRQRGKPVQVQAKRNWGFLAGSGTLALLLVAVVVYAVAHQGAGYRDPLQKLDGSFTGLNVAKGTLARDHVTTPVTYNQTPPWGGKHNPTPQVCKAYTQPVPNENAVHSLEHGAVWLTYLPSLPAAQIAQLVRLGTGNPYVLVSPYPGQRSPVMATAWGRDLSVQSAADPQLARFVADYASGPQTPEQGATCSVGNTSTGSTPGNTTGAGTMAPPAPATSPAR